jgi:hypothetical protein
MKMMKMKMMKNLWQKRDFRRFLPQSSISCTKFFCSTLGTCGAQSPKDFNMDNPLQAEGAVRGIRRRSDDIHRVTHRDARSRASLHGQLRQRRQSILIFNFQFSIRIDNTIKKINR